MIDLSLLRNENTRNLVIESEKNRFKSTETAVKVADLIEAKIQNMFEVEQLNKEINLSTKEGMKYFKIKEKLTDKEKTEKAEFLKRINEIKERKIMLSDSVKAKEKEIEGIAAHIANVLDKRVYISENEDENPVIIQTEKRNKSFWPTELLPYYVVLDKLGATDTARGAKVAGHKGYFLRDIGVILTQSLVRYAMDYLKKCDYTLMQTPFMMRKDLMERTVQLSDFDDQLYKIEGARPRDEEEKPGETKEKTDNQVNAKQESGSSEKKEKLKEKGHELYLIATSEQPLSALHHEEYMLQKELPIRYCGYSTCFRKEAGAHGNKNKGIFRVHQFEKIEQFIISLPEESDNEFNQMVERSKDFYDSLGLSYRVVSIVSGALNNAAAIKYDLEALFPSSNTYRELVSCSNCTDYQSRDLSVHYLSSKDGKPKYPHMLNGTLCAIQRTLCCLVENYQTEGGMMVPEVLVPYVGETFIPYMK